MALTQFSPLTVSMRDAKGFVARMRWIMHVNPQGANAGTFVVNFLAAWDALSNAAIVSYSGFSGQINAAIAYGTAANYQDVADKAVLVFQTAKGDLHRWEVPAPLTTIFLADQRTVNPVNGSVAAVITQMTTVISTDYLPTNRDGDPYTNFVGGYRRRSKEPRRVNIFTRDANLTPMEPEGP